MPVSANDHARVFEREASYKGKAYFELLARTGLDMRAEHELIPVYLPDPSKPTVLVSTETLVREDWNYSLAVLSPADTNWRTWGRKTLHQLISTDEPFEPLIRTGKRAASSAAGVDELTLAEVPVAFLKSCTPGQHLVLAPPRPPLEYLYNLARYVKETPADQLLSLRIHPTTWQPKLLGPAPLPTVSAALQEGTQPVIVQGPPGTGKTYLAAQLISEALARNERICVTSQAHRGLMELAAKPALDQWRSAGHIRKMGLSTAEQTELPELLAASDLTVPPGSALLATYYALSQWVYAVPEEPVYDLLIIEEASQAFLATIALFSRLAKRVLLIGDPQQLPPILEYEAQSASHITDKAAVSAVKNGLETLANSTYATGLRLTHTWRLGPRAARLTGLFYEGTLRSAPERESEPIGAASLPPALQAASSLGDGPVCVHCPANTTDVSTWAVEQAAQLAALQPQATLALLFPTQLQVRTAQALAASHPVLRHTRIETVDRMQGATVDYAFYVLGDLGSGFGLQPNRFNVATSRARRQTWVVVRGRGNAVEWIGGVVGCFWEGMLGAG